MLDLPLDICSAGEFGVEHLKINTKIAFDSGCCKLKHLPRKRRLNPNPEGVVHDFIGISQITADAVASANHVGLAGQVASKQQASANFVLV